MAFSPSPASSPLPGTRTPSDYQKPRLHKAGQWQNLTLQAGSVGICNPYVDPDC
ncbi:hypothetical protein DC3_12190 [Deinococcus cellulosilyticus NBRC 106333 = KACC 11606]|uniref:Uncharacterized protein n=1 Tax=Deinococcus cellulosilyticus (strain DSM 18568 / NBRC 106333 / KACC 11606 / 5516J-15) TaxID=1223518 RepID=A0A511MYB9_DEIC1|nr:hypothetical protein DC3_12190 [Deinococcus cellulosilyticus NBRC 106333 = KACC 11606]